MRPQTIAEKILSVHAGCPVYAGELCIVPVDGAMATDTTAPLAIRAFDEMGGEKLANPEKFHLIIDHAAPAPNERIANLHQLMRKFATEQNCSLFDIGSGICHQVMVDHNTVKPGDIFMGADSHTPTYGALNAFACGVGSTDLAAVMLTGKIWLKVPQSIQVILHGQRLQPGVSAKDIALEVVKQLTISGATYQSVEYHGSLLHQLSLSDRMVLCNMVAEMGAKTGIVSPEGLQLPYSYNPVFADKRANYTRVVEINTESLHPKIAIPHSPDDVHDVSSYVGTPITYGFIGTCTNGRLNDLHAAAEILKGKQIAKGVRLVIAPASRKVLLDAIKDGTLQILMEAGASIINSGCGPCVGTHDGVPGDGEIVISAANRNFQGRMGNPRSKIYLASPATVAISVLNGFISIPKEMQHYG
ncbi:MAG: 3-isopropylmalate dehydratase large subunit [Chitinophagia bacterium]|jgi:3-isopropylmalate/(R)-2-methylmalate dehydratase large subunit